MNEKNVIIPYVRIGKVIDFIKELPTGKSTLEELSNRFGRSTVQNILPTLQLLGLGEYDRKSRMIKLTNLGEKFRSLLITNDEKRAAEIIKPYVDKSEALSFIKMLLERKGSLSILDIGRELAFKFNKKWDNVVTYKTYGAACASILGFVGYGTYTRGLLRKIEVPTTKIKISPPYAGFKKITKIVETVSAYGEADLHTLSKELKTKEGRLSVEMKNCIDLGFLERTAPTKVAITSIGRDFINPLNRSRRSEVFREALLHSNFNKIISSISEKTIEFDAKELGEILKHQIGAKWLKDKTIITFGKKFLNWLDSSKLLEKTKNGRYKLIQDILKKAEKPQPLVLSITAYYELGKTIGTILHSNNFDKTKVSIEKLLEFCKQSKNLKTITELLEEHYNLFLELKDNRIFRADIKLLEEVLGLREGIKEG